MNQFFRLLLIAMLLNLNACSSYQTVSVERSMGTGSPTGIYPGTLVKVTMLDKDKATFRVKEVSETGLQSETAFYPYADMKTLKVDRSAEKKGDNAAIIWGLIGLAALIALIANADAVRVCSPPCDGPES